MPPLGWIDTVVNRVRMLVDNASLDAILSWESEVLARFTTGVATRRFVVYLAPETIAEMLSIGTTKRADQLQTLARLILRIFNGRVLNYCFWRILDEVRGSPPSPFLAASMARAMVEKINYAATAGSQPSREWLDRGAELIREEKADDKRWRTLFQQLYRDRDRAREGPSPLDDFIGTSTVRDLVLSRVEAICAKAEVPNPAGRASEIVDGHLAQLPALSAHVFLRVARLWWYTESNPNGRRVADDLFDDALLEYLSDLDLLLTPDRALTDFGRTVYPDKRILSPGEFCGEYLAD